MDLSGFDSDCDPMSTIKKYSGDLIFDRLASAIGIQEFDPPRFFILLSTLDPFIDRGIYYRFTLDKI